MVSASYSSLMLFSQLRFASSLFHIIRRDAIKLRLIPNFEPRGHPDPVWRVSCSPWSRALSTEAAAAAAAGRSQLLLCFAVVRCIPTCPQECAQLKGCNVTCKRFRIFKKTQCLLNFSCLCWPPPHYFIKPSASTIFQTSPK